MNFSAITSLRLMTSVPTKLKTTYPSKVLPLTMATKCNQIPSPFYKMAAMQDMHFSWPFNIPPNFSDKPTTYNSTIPTKYESFPSMIFCLSPTIQVQIATITMRQSAHCQATYAAANGEIRHTKHESKLPFPGLSQHASKADTFDSIPQSLMSLGKVSDNDMSQFTVKKTSSSLARVNPSLLAYETITVTMSSL
ncbi:hypothetical protein ACHAW6_005652 [Cyclotella cf. meneghiniana]